MISLSNPAIFMIAHAHIVLASPMSARKPSWTRFLQIPPAEWLGRKRYSLKHSAIMPEPICQTGWLHVGYGSGDPGFSNMRCINQGISSGIFHRGGIPHAIAVKNLCAGKPSGTMHTHLHIALGALGALELWWYLFAQSD